MGCEISTVKLLFFSLNFFWALSGAVTAILSGLALNVAEDEHFFYCIVGIILGFVATFLAIFGYVGLWRQSSCIMWIYCIFLGIVLGFQIAVLLNYHSHNFTQVITHEMHRLWSKEIEKPGTMAVTNQKYKCCGLHSWKDYEDLKLQIPSSCYKNNDNSEMSNIFDVGCLDVVLDEFVYLGKVIRFTNWILTGLEFTTIIPVIILAQKFRNQRSSYDTIT